jgi:hypothetical protein
MLSVQFVEGDSQVSSGHYLATTYATRILLELWSTLRQGQSFSNVFDFDGSGMTFPYLWLPSHDVVS